MKPFYRTVTALIVSLLISAPGFAEAPTWKAYPVDGLKERQKRGHAPLVSTTALKTEDGILIISDFGKDGEQIRCFDKFDDAYQPIGTRSCWRF